MHQAGQGGVGVVADRVGVLVRQRAEFVWVGDELAADGVFGVVDQGVYCGRDGDGVAGSDGLEPRAGRFWGEAGADKGVGGGEGHPSHSTNSSAL